MAHPFPLQTALTLALIGAAATAATWVRRHEFLPAKLAAEILDFQLPPRPIQEEPEIAARPGLRSFLEVPEGALDHFYAALWDTERRREGAITRVVHYGDSPTTADLITGDVREFFQQRFGNAGHGYVLPARPWAWYGHTGVSLDADGWESHPVTQAGAHDGLFGLGGVWFEGAHGRSRIVLRDPGHTRMELWFLRRPGGGHISVRSGETVLGEVDTAADAQSSGFETVALPQGTRAIELQASGGPVRIFGVSFENAGPGVVYDSLGLNGAFVTVLARVFNQAHWTGQLQHRRPALVIVNYGSNESGFARYIGPVYEGELRAAIARIRAALPETSILIMSPMDRAERVSGGEVETLPTIPKLVEIQRRVARETGCAFYDTFHAMGGSGTMAKWYVSKPRLVSADYLHPFPAGARIVGQQFFQALSLGFNLYKLQHLRTRPARTVRAAR